MGEDNHSEAPHQFPESAFRAELPLRELLYDRTMCLLKSRDGVSHAELTRLIETVRTNVVAKQA